MNGGSVIFGTHLLFVTQSEKKNQLSRFWMKESKRSKELEPGTPRPARARRDIGRGEVGEYVLSVRIRRENRREN